MKYVDKPNLIIKKNIIIKSILKYIGELNINIYKIQWLIVAINHIINHESGT